MAYQPFISTVSKQNTIEKWTKKKGDIGIMKNRGITFTSIAAKIYNALLLKCINFEIEKILKKNQNYFQRNQSPTSDSDSQLNH